MASELSRALECTGDEASESMLSLRPHEMKTLLHHLLCGTEFGAAVGKRLAGRCDMRGHAALITRTAQTKAEKTGMNDLKENIAAKKSGLLQKSLFSEDEDGIGLWLRRRRIDGALNRVPANFYSKIWRVLWRSASLEIEASLLHQSLTREMTMEETKFALTMESVLNRIPEPEYRQLMVEALMVFSVLAEAPSSMKLDGNAIKVREIVKLANHLFVQDQMADSGDSSLCCAAIPPTPCDGVAGLCIHFIDSPPSGPFGTLNYMCRAVAQIMHQGDDDIECTVS